MGLETHLPAKATNVHVSEIYSSRLVSSSTFSNNHVDLEVHFEVTDQGKASNMYQ